MKKCYSSKSRWRSSYFHIDFLRRVCDDEECKEKGRVIWNSRDGKFVHIRFDNCMASVGKKCDCIILYFSHRINKPVIFIVEVKGIHYRLDEVAEKLQRCVDILRNVLNGNINRVIIIPVLYADRHCSMAKRAVSSYKINCPTGHAIITLLNNGDNICKALKV
jgi:hypothetical protein